MTEPLRPELERPLPHAMGTLRVVRGYPVPWFVDWYPDGTPEFRAMDRAKWHQAVNPRETLTSPPTWWAEGRPATRAEILASIESGFPLLEATLTHEPHPEAARAELYRRRDLAMKLLPAA